MKNKTLALAYTQWSVLAPDLRVLCFACREVLRYKNKVSPEEPPYSEDHVQGFGLEKLHNTF